jgi:hypothetical protein
MRQRRADPARQRQHGAAEEHAVGLLIVRIGVVAGDAEQHRRHAQGQRDLARRGVLGLQEIHVLGRQRHRLPIEPAFEEKRPPGVARPLVLVLQFALEPLELALGQHRALRARIHQRAAWARRVVEQRLVPRRSGVVGVDGNRRRLDRREAIMIVERMKECQMQDRRHGG